MEDNSLSNDSDILKEIKDAENEYKRDNFRNNITKNKLIKELKGGLGDIVKNNPNKIENYRKVDKLNFTQRIIRFLSNIFKSF